MSNNNFDWAGFWSSHKNYFDSLDAKYKAEEAEREEKYKGMTTREVMEARHKELMEQEKNKYHTALNDTLNTTLGGYGTETKQPLYQDGFTQSNSVFQPTNTDVNNTFGVQNNMNNTGYQFNTGLSETSPMSGTHTTPKPSFWDRAKDVGLNTYNTVKPYIIASNSATNVVPQSASQTNHLLPQQYKEVDTFAEYLAQTPPELRSHLTEPGVLARIKQFDPSVNNPLKIIPHVRAVATAGSYLYDNWRLMHDIKNRPGNDNEMHRRAQTQIAQQGLLPAMYGQFAGYLKEKYDIDKKINRDKMPEDVVREDSNKDLDNNFDGMRAGLLYPHLSNDVIYRDFDDKRNKWRVPLQ